MKTFAKKGLITIFTALLLFHLMVIVRVIPYTIVWAGRLNSDIEMYLFETVSFLLNAFFLFVVLIKTNYTKTRISTRVITGLLWAMGFLFFLNTIGNLFSKSNFELLLFTPVTAILCVFSIITALDK